MDRIYLEKHGIDLKFPWWDRRDFINNRLRVFSRPLYRLILPI